MANNEFTIPIPARLKNVAKGGHVAGAKDIIDDALGKEQSEINQEVSEAIEGNTEAVATERQRAVAAEGALNNRLSNVEELAEISIDGGEAKIATGDDFNNPTAEQRAKVTTVGAILDGADDEPTPGSDNLVKSGGVYSNVRNLRNRTLKIENTLNIEGNKDTFYVTDLGGNVVAKINSYGIQSIGYKDAAGNEIIHQINNILLQLTQKVDKIDNKGLSTNDYTDIDKNFIGALKTNDSGFYITDIDGNVILQADWQGLKAINFISKDGINIVDVIKLLKSTTNSLYNSYDDSFYITDLGGNIVCKVDNDGVHDVKHSKYELFSIGDSLSTPGIWQRKIANILGCKFDNTKNNKPGMNLSTGGTMTAGGALTSGFYRAKNLVDQNVISGQGENAIIILENINDSSVNISGSITDNAIIPKTVIEGDFDLTSSAITSQQLATIPIGERKLDACINCYKTTSNGKRLTITALPSRNGNITLYVGNAGTSHQRYDITVQTGDTYEDIVAKILEYNYTGVMDIDGGDGKSVIFGDRGSTLYVSFVDTDSTGMTCTITDNVTARMSYPIYFTSNTLEDWEDNTKWSDGWYLTTYRAWKSVIQYLIGIYPKAHIIIAGFPSHSTNPNDYLLSDGSLDFNEWYNTDRENRGRLLRAFLKEIADFYNIPYIDVANMCGINLSNYLTYQEVNNVHPKTIGYERLGETIARYLQTIL